MNDTRLEGARRPDWVFTLLDEADRPLKRLRTVSAWSLDLNPLAQLGDSGSLTLLVGVEGVDFMRHRVKVSYDPGVEGVDPWGLGVFLFAEPGLDRQETHSTTRVGLVSKLAVLDDDKLEESYTVPKGANIVQTVLALVESTGETRVTVTASGEYVREPIVFDAGESKLAIVNQLLDAVGYWGITVDGEGVLTSSPYVPPAERPVKWEFVEGEHATHSGEWSREQDLTGVPNRVVCRTAGTDEEPALVGVALNEDPVSRFSFQARGRWVTRVYDVEATSQAQINAMAQRRLLEAGSPVATVSVEHAVLPLRPRDLVVLESSPLRVRATVQKLSVVSPGFLMSSELREVPA
ncbi:MAG: hypothetical protein Q4D87_09015 [Actinomycetaceae bacterium]|nr:hypothetical protein [Actinomycetaceae bacterium]